jgi:two-component system, NarL family, response regulator FusR
MTALPATSSPDTPRTDAVQPRTAAPTARRRLALVDDHAVVRLGYRRLLELESDLEVVAEFGDAGAAEQALCGDEALPLDLLLLDLSMPGRSGLDMLHLLARCRPDLHVLVVSMHDSPSMVAQCLQAGAAGFIAKSSAPEAVVHAVRAVLDAPASGRTAAPLASRRRLPHDTLTEREAEVLRYLLTGMGVEACAHLLGLSDKTVANYQTLIRQKLGVANSVELVNYARQHGLAP